MTNHHAVQREPVAFHMGDASEIVRLLATEKASSRVDNESLGVMGATEVTVWDTKIGLSIELHSGNGGQTAYLYPAPQPAEQQPVPDVAELVEALEQGFPLLSDEGLDEVEHHCEYVIQRERKRVHSILAAHRKQGGEA